mgnify:CR=1 FL=1
MSEFGNISFDLPKNQSNVIKVIGVGDKIVTEVENNGKLSSNKGVNFPNTVINIEVITPKDEHDLLWGLKTALTLLQFLSFKAQKISCMYEVS